MNSEPTPLKYTTREAFAEALLTYINTELPLVHPKAAGRDAFHRESPLFGEGGIDSLGIVHIVGFLESALGTELSLADINMKNFATVEKIAGLYWARRNDAR